MASTIEERVVEMKFDNQEFERNVQTSISTLDKLKMALDLDGAAKGFNKISDAADKVDISGLEKAADAVSVKFSAMQVAGITAIQQLTLAFMNFGKRLWNISFGQIKSGGMARALKIEQANFKLQALAKNIEGVKDNVDGFVEEMSKAADAAVTGTAYGYDSAMSVVSQLVASGIKDASKMESYLKGIAGAAAMTGRSFDDIGNIFTTIASNGKLMTMQLRQFSASGLNVSAELARQFGKTEQEINAMVTAGKIGFQEFADALSEAYGDSAQKADDTYAGVTSNIKAQLSRLGQLFAAPYIENMIPALQKLKAAIKSLNNAIKPVAKRFETFMQVTSKVLQGYFEHLDFSRVDAIFRGLENIFWGIAMVLYTIKDAFEEVFPKKTLQELQNAAYEFERFTESILPTNDALLGIKNGVKLILTPVKLVVKIIGSVIKALKPVIYMIFQFVYAVLSLGSAFGGIVDGMIEFISQCGILDMSLQIIATVAATVIRVFTALVQIVGALFKMAADNGAIQSMGNALKSVIAFIEGKLMTVLAYVYVIMVKIFDLLSYENISRWASGFYHNVSYVLGILWFSVKTIFDGVSEVSSSDGILANGLKLVAEFFKLIFEFFKGGDIQNQAGAVKTAFDKLKDSIRFMGDAIRELVSDMNGDKLMMFAFASVFILFSLSLVRLLQSLAFATDQVGGLARNLSFVASSFNTVKHLIKNSKMFLYYATSIVVIAGAMYQLSQVDTEKLLIVAGILALFTAALVGFAFGIEMLTDKKNMTPQQAMEIAAISKAILSIAGSVALLALAMRFLVNLQLDLKKTIGAIAIMTTFMAVLGAMSIAVSQFGAVDKGKTAGKLAFTALSILAMGFAIKMVVKAFSDFSQLDVEITIAKVGAFIAALVTFGAVMFLASNATIGAALSMLSFAMLLSLVLSSFEKIATMDVTTLDAGLKMIMRVLNKTLIPLIATLGIVSRIGHGYMFDMGGLSLVILSIIPFISAMAFLMAYLGSVKSSLTRGAKAIGAIMLMLMAFVYLVGALTTALSVLNKDTALETSTTNLENGKGKSLFKRQSTRSKPIAKLFGITGMIIALSIAVSIMAVVMVGLSKVESSLWRGFKALSAIIAMITISMGAILLAAKTDQYKKMQIAPILALMVTLGLLISSLIGLTYTAMADPAALTAAGIILAVIMGALAAILNTMSKHNFKGNIVNETNVKGSAGDLMFVMLTLTPLIIAIGAFFKLASQNSVLKEPEAIIGLVEGLLVILASVLLFYLAMQKLTVKVADSKKLYALAAIIASLAVLITAVGIAMYALNIASVGTNNLANAGSMFIVLAGLFGGMFFLLKEIRTFTNVIGTGHSLDLFLNTMVAVAGMVIPLMAVTASLYLLKDADWDSIVASALGMAAMILVLGYLLKITKKVVKKVKPEQILSFAGTIILLSSALVILAGAFSMMTWDENSGAKIGVFVGALVVFGILAAIMSDPKKTRDFKKAFATAAIIAALAGSLIIVAHAFNKLTITAQTKWGPKLAVFGAAIYAFTVCLTALKGISSSDWGTLLAAAGSIVAVSSSFIIIAHAFNALEVDDDWLKKLGVLAGLFAELMVFFAIIKLISSESEYMNAELLIISASIVLISSSLLLISEALRRLDGSGFNSTQLHEIMDAMTWLIGVIGGIAAVLSLIAAFAPDVGLIAAVVSAIMGVIAALILAVTLGTSSIINSFTKFCEFMDKFGDEANEKVQKILDNLKTLIRGISDLAPEIGAMFANLLITVFAVLLVVMTLFQSEFVAYGISTVLACMAGIAASLPLILELFTTIVNDLDEWAHTGQGYETMQKAATFLGETFKLAFGAALGSLSDVVVEAFRKATSVDEAVKEGNDRSSIEFNYERQLGRAYRFTGKEDSLLWGTGYTLGTPDADRLIHDRIAQQAKDVYNWEFNGSNIFGAEDDKELILMMDKMDRLHDAILNDYYTREQLENYLRSWDLSIEDFAVQYAETIQQSDWARYEQVNELLSHVGMSVNDIPEESVNALKINNWYESWKQINDAISEGYHITELTIEDGNQRMDNAIRMFGGAIDDVDLNRLRDKFSQFRNEVETNLYPTVPSVLSASPSDREMAAIQLDRMLSQYDMTKNIANSILNDASNIAEVLDAMEQSHLTIEDIVLKYSEVAGLSDADFNKIYHFFSDNKRDLDALSKLQVQALDEAIKPFEEAKAEGLDSFIDSEGTVVAIGQAEDVIIKRIHQYYKRIYAEMEHGAGSVGENSSLVAYKMAQKPMRDMFSDTHVTLRNNLSQLNEEAKQGVKAITKTIAMEDDGPSLGDSISETAEQAADGVSDVLSTVLDPNSEGYKKAAEFASSLGIDLGEMIANGMSIGIGNFDLTSILSGGLLGNTQALNQAKLEQQFSQEWQAAVQASSYNPNFKYEDSILAQYKDRNAYVAARVAEYNANNNTAGLDSFLSLAGIDTEQIKDDVKEITDGIMPDTTAGMNAMTDAMKDATSATDTLADSIHNALDIFSEFNVDLSMTANDVLRNFSSQLIGVTGWSKELSALAGRGISQAVLEDLAAAGPEAYDRVHALYTATASQLALFNAMYEQKLSLEKSTANDICESFEKNGSVIAEGAKDVVASATTEIATVQDQVVAASRIGVNEMEQGVLDAHKIGMEFEYVNGVIIPEGIKDAIKNSTPGVAAIFGEMGYQSLEAFKHYMNVEDAITMVEGFQEALKESIGNSLDIFAEVSDKEEISSEEMLRRMRENVKNVGKWANNLRSLAARGMDEALLAELQALGPAGADKVAAFAKMTDSQLKQANQAFAAKAALPQYVADNLTKSYAEAGFNTTLGFVEGIDPTAAEEVMTALGTYSLDALKASLDIHSPSEKTREAGMYSVMGMVIGVEENLPMIEDVGSKMGDALLSSCFTVNPEKLAASVAMFMTAVQGVVSGYQDKKGTDWMASYEEWIFNELLTRLEEIDKRGEFQLHVTPVWASGSNDMEQLATRYQNANKRPGWNAARDTLIKNNGQVPASMPGFSVTRSINAASNIKTAPTNTGYANELRDISQLLKATRDEVSGIRGNVSQLQAAFAGMQVTLDGATVGKMMTPYVNANLGNTYVRDKRRKL